LIAVIFTRRDRWDPDRELQAQDGLDGHIEFIRRNRDLGVVIESAPFHDPWIHVTDERPEPDAPQVGHVELPADIARGRRLEDAAL
jgi:hypothetical protein